MIFKININRNTTKPIMTSEQEKITQEAFNRVKFDRLKNDALAAIQNWNNKTVKVKKTLNIVNKMVNEISQSVASIKKQKEQKEQEEREKQSVMYEENPTKKKIRQMLDELSEEEYAELEMQILYWHNTFYDQDRS